MGWIPPSPPVQVWTTSTGIKVTAECRRCHCYGPVELATGLCERCLRRLLFCREVPPAYRMVPDVPTEEQAIEVFTFCAETVLLHWRVERLIGVRK